MKLTAYGKIISDDVKKSVISYMRKCKIPVTLSLFKLGIRKCFNDELFVKKNESSDENHSEVQKKRQMIVCFYFSCYDIVTCCSRSCGNIVKKVLSYVLLFYHSWIGVVL